jgi:hypothetical protein
MSSWLVGVKFYPKPKRANVLMEKTQKLKDEIVERMKNRGKSEHLPMRRKKRANTMLHTF